MKTLLSVILFSFVFWPCSAESRPEYSAENGITSCVACHVSPIGSGMLNIAGKQFGFHGYEGGSTPPQDLFQIDLRALGVAQEYYRTSDNGFGLMELLGAVNVPIEEKGAPETRLVATYNFGTFMTGLRDTYVRWQNAGSGLVPEYATLGLFHAPFGLLTDEHRTYVRIQSRTTHNDFYFGLMGSYDVKSALHLDVALTNGFQDAPSEGSGRLSQGLTAGLVGNLRYSFPAQGVFIGSSARYNARHTPERDPYAGSVYMAFSLGRLTEERIPLTFLAEASLARYWNDADINPEFARMFLPSDDLGLAEEVKTDTSLGVLAQINFSLTPKWVLLYKFDRLNLSVDRSRDTFNRHGFGFRHFVSRYFELQARYEFADSDVIDLPKTAIANQNTFWTMLRFWH